MAPGVGGGRLSFWLERRSRRANLDGSEASLLENLGVSK